MSKLFHVLAASCFAWIVCGNTAFSSFDNDIDAGVCLAYMQELVAGDNRVSAFAAVAPGGGPNDAQTSICYDAETGEIAVDAPAGRGLTSVNIDSAACVFTGAPADLSMGSGFVGSFDNGSDCNIFKVTFGSSFGSGSFGNVAEMGLSEDFIAKDLTVVGSVAGGHDLGPADLIYIPEPSSLLLALLGIIGLLRWRRT